ncbi:hypothetical protein SPHFLASMR4Y_00479 [Sphingorhabdus sp. SMR4y]|nr:hypothetical protein SPHFLASMR4Y_00479 [Sphingorhabdus sp. SMR4y]
MDEILGSVQLDEKRFLHLGMLSPHSLTDLESEELGFDGYFLFETDDDEKSKGISILGKAPTLDAAFRLLEIWQRSMSRDVGHINI